MELAHRSGRMVTQLEPAPGSQNWLQVLRDAEVVEHLARDAGSSAFRQRTAKAKAIITGHIVNWALHHGVVLASNSCVLINEAGDRAAVRVTTILPDP